MTPDQERKLNDVYDFMLSMKAEASIPFDVAEAISQRFGIGFETSGKTAASETQDVDEAGSSNYQVSKPPDGFIIIGGKNVPYHD